jgi:hypothetical protein
MRVKLTVSMVAMVVALPKALARSAAIMALLPARR